MHRSKIHHAGFERVSMLKLHMTDGGDTGAGQAVSSRPDVTPPSYTKELEKLQDQIPPFDHAAAMQVITDELGRPPSSVFSSMSPNPIAAASLGQVPAPLLTLPCATPLHCAHVSWTARAHDLGLPAASAGSSSSSNVRGAHNDL